MPGVNAEVKTYYKSGFPKQVSRGKLNLTLNGRLKAARNRTGLSSASVVKELAKLGIAVGHSTIQGYEADENSLNHRYPSLSMLIVLAHFYGCSFDYLLGVSDKFQIANLDPEIDLKDVLESECELDFNGTKLTRKQREALSGQLDLIFT